MGKRVQHRLGLNKRTFAVPILEIIGSWYRHASSILKLEYEINNTPLLPDDKKQECFKLIKEIKSEWLDVELLIESYEWDEEESAPDFSSDHPLVQKTKDPFKPYWVIVWTLVEYKNRSVAENHMMEDLLDDENWKNFIKGKR